MKKSNTFIVSAAVTAAVIAACWLLLVAPGLTGNEINMTRGVTSQSVLSYQLHMIIRDSLSYVKSSVAWSSGK